MFGLNIGDVVAVLRMDSTQFTHAIEDAKNRLVTFSKTVGSVGAFLSWRLSLPLGYFAKKATDSFAKFDDTITRSAAVTKGMTGIIRKEMADTALALSEKSLLSATELAGGYFALGQAGYSAAQAIKVLPVAEDFATASSTSLNTAIQYLSRSVEGLGIASEDPIKMMESMVKVSNAFTYASITTTAEIEDFAIAMTHAAAPALRMVNKSVEEGVAALMAFARAGIVSEEAGTLLWTSIRDLQNANIKARGAWNRFNLTVYDSAGKMRNLADIFGDLEERFGGMSHESAKATLKMLGFQDRSLRGILALMGFSEEMRTFQTEMEKGGDLAEKVANTFRSSFLAQITMAKHKIDVLKISIGWYLSPVIMKLNDWIGRVTVGWKNLSDEARAAIVLFGLVAVAGGPMLWIFSKLTIALADMVQQVPNLGTSMFQLVKAFTLVNLSALPVILSIAAILSAVYTLRAMWIENVGGIQEATADLINEIKSSFAWLIAPIGDFFTWFGRSAKQAFDYVRGSYKDLIKDMFSLTMASGPALGKLWEGIKRGWKAYSVSSMISEFREGWESAGRTFAEEFVTAFDTIDTHLTPFVSNVKSNLSDAMYAVKHQLKRDIESLGSVLTNMLPEEKLREVLEQVEKIKKGVSDAFSNDINTPIGTFKTHLMEVTDLAERFQEVAVRAFESTADAITDMVMSGKADIRDLANTILRDLIGTLIRAQMASIITGFRSGEIFSLFGGGKIAPDVNPAMASVAHRGGVPMYDALPSRLVFGRAFEYAERYHSGIGPGERRAIIREDEGVFTKGQMRALGLRINKSSDSETNMLLREILRATRQKAVVNPLVIDRREDTATILAKNTYRRGTI